MVDEALIDTDAFQYALSMGRAWLDANKAPIKIRVSQHVPNIERGSLPVIESWSFNGSDAAVAFHEAMDVVMKDIFKGERGFGGEPDLVNFAFADSVLLQLLEDEALEVGYTVDKVAEVPVPIFPTQLYYPYIWTLTPPENCEKPNPTPA